MSKGSESAFPGQEYDRGGQPSGIYRPGLTKREKFAESAMRAIRSNPEEWAEVLDTSAQSGITPEEIVAVRAVDQADALLAALQEEEDDGATDAD